MLTLTLLILTAQVPDLEPDEDAVLPELPLVAEPPRAEFHALKTQTAVLGTTSLLKDRLENALDALPWSDAALPEDALAPVTDIEALDVAQLQRRYDIPLEMQPLVAQYIRFFQGGGRKWFRRWVSRSHRYVPLMQPILESYGLPRDTVYLAMIESGFNTRAKSWARAVGPWQFMSPTARDFELREDFWVDERRDPIKSTHAAARYLKMLHGELGHWYLAWAGYNTGQNRMRRLMERWGTTAFWELSTYEKHQGPALMPETKHYVPKLIACALVAGNLEAFGFSPDEFTPETPFEFDEIPLTTPVDLAVIARTAGVSLEDVQDYNPELKRWCTPPASEEQPYILRLPRGSRDNFTEALAALPPAEQLHFKVHHVGKGDTLSQLARKYGAEVEAIVHMNQLPDTRGLKLGAELIIPIEKSHGRVNGNVEQQKASARRAGVKAPTRADETPTTTGTVSVAHVEGKTRITYGVGRGDTLWSIARRFDVHVTDLREWNPALGSAKGLQPGAALTVWPGPAARLGTP